METPSRKKIDDLFAKLKASLAKNENERMKGKGGKRVDEKKSPLFGSQIIWPKKTSPMKGVDTSCAPTAGESNSTDGAALGSKSPESSTRSCPSPYASTGSCSRYFQKTSSFASFRRTECLGAQSDDSTPQVKPLVWDKPSFGQDLCQTQREDEKARKDERDAVQKEAATEQIGRKRSRQDCCDGNIAFNPVNGPLRKNKWSPEEIAGFVAFADKWIPSAKRHKLRKN